MTLERDYHDTCRAALDAMIEGAGEQVIASVDVSASGADAEVLGFQLRTQAKQMSELPRGPLFFGRLDFQRSPRTAGDHAGQSYHVGRLRITEHPSSPPLVVDWRAPVSRAFYRASARDPQGVAVRRRFGWAPGGGGDSSELTGFEDERVAYEPEDERVAYGGEPYVGAVRGRAVRAGEVRGEGEVGEGGSGAVPGGILAAEIERPRVGPMRDIAATIQPEQDTLVRGELSDSVCVQGAPGTGKTAVGLHRAAYLLYTYPRRVQRGGLLILGPDRTFLRYIAEVLPSLGEIGVRQSTVRDETARHPVTATDTPAAEAVKHDIRMALVLRRALYARVGGVCEEVAVTDGSYRWRVPLGELERIVDAVREEEPPYAVGRERVRSRVVAHIRARAERRAGPVTHAWVQRTGRARSLSAYVDAVWPKVRPEEVVDAVLTDPVALAEAAEGVLTRQEQRVLMTAGVGRGAARSGDQRAGASPAGRGRRAGARARSRGWTEADLVLLDEVAGLIEHPESYGHIVIDEAQDLSPMQCRVIARRAGFGSVTVLGDLAQGTTPWAAGDWPALLGHLGKPEASLVRLTTGFRVPGAIVALANRLLATLGVDVPAGRSLREDGELSVRRVTDVATATVEAVQKALTHEGSVGVIAADADIARLREALSAAGAEPAGPDDLGARLTLLPATRAKGLEYDHVVAVEPAAIAEAEPRGAHRLYVVLTRAVSRLDVLHSRPLPFGAE
ncbi:AAA family ATPase [Streptomyces tsukubensis]|uniref:AAA family ATPase n=1 Tax=Streptomyces tsukubensis TaxID=83656 RepID=A0A1V4A9G6_9ACTN|nr:AAA family ATPase [Streptomyces tsukubensis]QFR97793.1 AAA family ATPase [Streptomyces tsukubensis]